MGFFEEDRWTRIRQRYEAWWEGELLGLPLVQVTAPKELQEAHLPPSGEQELFNWFTDPELVLPRLERSVNATYYAGDAFPWVDPVSHRLVAIEAAYLGAPYRISTDTLTGWVDPLIEDWAGRPKLAAESGNRWWKATQRLLEEGARRSQGRYILAIPDLQGGGEILALLRGSQELALDLIDHSAEIRPAIEEINLAWRYYFDSCYEIIHRWQPGYVDWLGVWSESPAVTVECDFAGMVSPRMFQSFFLPAIEQQTSWIGRTIFHLDGPQAIPHLDALLALPGLKGIQWVPTPDRPCPMDWIALLRRIQAGGKRVVTACDPDEVLPLLEALQPEGILLTTTCRTPAEADELVEALQRR